jgi:hypothetical protein
MQNVFNLYEGVVLSKHVTHYGPLKFSVLLPYNPPLPRDRSPLLKIVWFIAVFGVLKIVWFIAVFGVLKIVWFIAVFGVLKIIYSN